MRLVNQITESLREDVKNITMLLTNRKNKETGDVKVNQKIFIKIIQHRGIISMRELVIDYVINALLPVIETTISGQMYYDKIIGAKYSWDSLMIKLYLDFYRIRRELVRLKCEQASKIARMLEKIKNVPTLDFNKLKESVL